jgi:hypothetical protein
MTLSAVRSVMKLWAAAWVMNKGRRAASAAACGVTPQA